MFSNFLILVAPKYNLNQTAVKVEAGQSVSIKFSVATEPHSGEISKHTLRKEGSESISTPYEILENEIVFNEVLVEDSGTYIISCSNEAGEGSSSFNLNVAPLSQSTKGT